jgi:hypothetical protein
MTKKITGGKWFWESSENGQTVDTSVQSGRQEEPKSTNTFMSYFTLPSFLKSKPSDNIKTAQTPAASNMLGGKRKSRKSKRSKKSKKSKTSKAKK